MSSLSLQVLYLLELSTLEIKLITQTVDHMGMGAPSFSLDVQLILVPWDENVGLYTHFHVHDRSGHCLSRFQMAGMPELPPSDDASTCCSHAHIQGGRAAFAQGHVFLVLDLCSGQVLGRRGLQAPVMEDPTVSAAGGLVTVSKAGSRLAFCAHGSTAIHLYDALTLAPLGNVCPIGPDTQAYLLGPQAGLCSIGFCGGGWALRAYQSSTTPADGQALLVSRIQQGSGELEVKLCFEARAAPYPVVSPSAAFVCTYEACSAVLAVYDTRSGQEILTQDVRLPEGVPEVAADCKSVSIGWSHCESRLHVKSTFRNQGKVVDYVLVVRF